MVTRTRSSEPPSRVTAVNRQAAFRKAAASRSPRGDRSLTLGDEAQQTDTRFSPRGHCSLSCVTALKGDGFHLLGKRWSRQSPRWTRLVSRARQPWEAHGPITASRFSAFWLRWSDKSRPALLQQVTENSSSLLSAEVVGGRGRDRGGHGCHHKKAEGRVQSRAAPGRGI